LKNRTGEAMSRAPKMTVAVALFVTSLASMGVVGLKDSLKRPEYCVTCHPDPYYTSWEDSDYLAEAHARAAIPCQTCHAKSLGAAMMCIVTQMKGDYRLRKLKVSNDACLRCHAHQNYAELIGRTEYVDFNVSTPLGPSLVGYESLAWVASQNPHDSFHYGEMDCRICHKMHEPSVDFCSECHEPAASGAGWTIKVRKKGPIPTPTRLPPMP
jgi:hypothetical protein